MYAGITHYITYTKSLMNKIETLRNWDENKF